MDRMQYLYGAHSVWPRHERAPVIQGPQIPLEVLEVSQRTRNCLLADNICTVHTLLHLPHRYLRTLPGLGKKGLADLLQSVKNRGYEFEYPQ